MSQTANADTSNRTSVMERIFSAPRELVFETFTNAEHLKNWYGPKDWTLPVSKLDLREGGSWNYCMQGPTGREMWGRADYHKIIPPEMLSYTESIVDKGGNVMQGMPQMHVTLSFEDLGDKTTKITNSIVFDTVQEFEMSTKGGMSKGFEQAYDSLDDLLKTLV